MFLFCNARTALEFGLLCLMVEKSTRHMLEREKELHLHHGKKMLKEKLESLHSPTFLDFFCLSVCDRLTTTVSMQSLDDFFLKQSTPLNLFN